MSNKGSAGGYGRGKKTKGNQTTRRVSQAPARGNKGGALRGQARAAQVQGLNTARKAGRSQPDPNGSVNPAHAQALSGKGTPPTKATSRVAKLPATIAKRGRY